MSDVLQKTNPTLPLREGRTIAAEREIVRGGATHRPLPEISRWRSKISTLPQGEGGTRHTLPFKSLEQSNQFNFRRAIELRTNATPIKIIALTMGIPVYVPS